ncbi:MAG TPA: HEAT repeat domain-containing protein [Steroidobacteraceae bacterium]|nr:HEAT repeat domain-containing protein [Steroidobacteraceae bacterium]
MNTFRSSLPVVALLLAHAVIPPAYSAELKLPRDGWVSWQVAAVDDAPAWCCWSHLHDRVAPRPACGLDGGSNGYGIRDDAKTDSVKVYVRVAGGKIDRLQALSATCPVEAKTPIQELDGVAADDSARWLIARTRQAGADGVSHRPLAESSLAALAMHRGDLARDALSEFARGDAHVETRKWAVFWLAKLRGAEGAAVTSSVMFNDKDAELRKHAAFAMAQSKSPRVTPDLIRLGNTDKVGDVRAKAWFWLAHTGAVGSEQAIAQALRKDAEDDVREQVILALSLLPEERATRALIATAEDRSLSIEQRKRAVFWLSQSESGSALAYMDKVLARTQLSPSL